MGTRIIPRVSVLLLALAVPSAFAAGWWAADPAFKKGPPAKAVVKKAAAKSPPTEAASRKDAPPALERAWAQLDDLADAGSLTLRFSQALDPLQAPPQVTVTPAVSGLITAVSGNALILRGALAGGQTYAVQLPINLRFANGKTLGASQPAQVGVSARRTRLRLARDNGILSPAGHLQLEAKVVGAAQIRLSACRVSEKNLLWALQGGDDHQVARDLKPVTVAVPGDVLKPQNLVLELRRLLADKQGQVAPGLYRIRVRADEKAGGEEEANGLESSDCAIVSVGDLALVAESGEGEISAWASGVSTGLPASDVAWQVLAQNGEVLATADGDASGLVKLALPKGNPDGGPFLLLAKRGVEMAWLELRDHGRIADALPSGGRGAPAALDACVYAERGAYRPGEKIHLSALVRNQQGLPPAAGVPLEMALFRPDGRLAAQLPVKIGEQGFLHGDFTPEVCAQRGQWQAQLRLPGKLKTNPVIGHASFLFDAFEPVKLAVAVAMPAPHFYEGQQAQVSAQAKWLFGAPGAGVPARIEASASREAFVSPTLKDFVFPDQEAGRRTALEVTAGAFDAAGKANLAVDDSALKKASQQPGRWRIQGSVAALEDSGRATCAPFTTTLDTAKVFVGLKDLGWSVRPGTTALSIALRDGQDRPVPNLKVAASLWRLDWDWRLVEKDGVRRWESIENNRQVWQAQVNANDLGLGQAQMPVAENGAYELRLAAQAKNGAAPCACRFYAWEGEGEAPGLKPETPGEMTLTLDKKQYLPGETAKVSLNAAFEGTLMVAVEGEKVLWRRVLPWADRGSPDPQETKPAASAPALAPASSSTHSSTSTPTAAALESRAPGATTRRVVEIPISPDWRGSVVVRAWVVRPLDPKRDAWLPLRAFGAAQLILNPAAHELPLTLEAPKEGQPGATVTVTAHAVPGSVVHLWAVDEGILAVTAFKTPKPLDWFFAARRPLMDALDLYDDLLPDYLRPKTFTRIGGDVDEEKPADGAAKLRLGSVDLRDLDPRAVFWRQAAVAGPDGGVAAQVPLPENPTRVRVMAVAAKDDAYGAGEAGVEVRGEWLLMANAPKVVAPGDQFEVTARVIHHGDKAAKITVQAQTPNGLTCASQTAQVPAEGEVVLHLLAQAKGGEALRGEVNLRLMMESQAAQAPTELAKRLLPVSIRPLAVLGSVGRFVRLAPGSTTRLNASEGFVGAARWHLAVRPTPLVECLPVVEALMAYPHGCGEQTSSGLRAVVAAGQVLAGDPSRKALADHMAAHGVARLAAMQCGDGGMPYWPGGNSEPWVSAYAAKALGEAQAAGVKVPAELREKLLDYLAGRMDGANDRDNAWSPLQRVLALRAMAELDSPQDRGLRGRAEGLLAQHLAELPLEGRANLALVLVACGRRDLANGALGDLNKLAHSVAGRVNNGCGDISAMAAALEAAVKLDRPEKDLLAAQLIRAKFPAGSWWGPGWGATSADAAAVRALFKWGASDAGNAAAGLPQLSLQGADGQTLAKSGAALDAEEVSKGEMVLKNSGAAPAFASFFAEGWRAPGAEEAAHGLQVTRRFLSLDGKPLAPVALKAGDLVVMETTVALTPEANTDSASRLVLTLDLPGGLALENTHLATASAAAKENQDHLRLEPSDGRLVVFGALWRHAPLVSRVVLRATARGTFAVGPAQASDMDDPTLCGMDGAPLKVEVK